VYIVDNLLIKFKENVNHTKMKRKKKKKKKKNGVNINSCAMCNISEYSLQLISMK
jgi:hypothetical protein